MTREQLEQAAQDSSKEFTTEASMYQAVKPVVEEYGDRSDVNSLETAHNAGDTDAEKEVIVSVESKIVSEAESVKDDSDEAQPLKDAYIKMKAAEGFLDDTVEDDGGEE